MPPAIPFDPSVFRRSQDFCAATPTKKLLTKIPVRKPAPEWFIRTHTDPAYRFPTQVIELKEDRELYLVANVLADALDGEATLRSKLIVPAVNRQGALFLWPLGLPGPSGQTNPWHDSAREAADSAVTQWIRLASNMSAGCYETTVATGTFPEPEFPEGLSLEQMLGLAFSGKIISDLDHPILRKLRGEI